CSHAFVEAAVRRSPSARNAASSGETGATGAATCVAVAGFAGGSRLQAATARQPVVSSRTIRFRPIGITKHLSAPASSGDSFIGPLGRGANTQVGDGRGAGFELATASATLPRRYPGVRVAGRKWCECEAAKRLIVSGLWNWWRGAESNRRH